jgi:tetratricopeptide (TPR) repeat protein
MTDISPTNLARERELVKRAPLLVAQGRYDEAEAALRAAMAGFDEVLGADSRETADCAQQLAGLLSRTGRASEAADLYRRVLDIRRRLLGPVHPGVANALHNLALACEAAGHPEEASGLWAEARSLMEDHPVEVDLNNDPEYEQQFRN